jgi:hypothetical protein
MSAETADWLKFDAREVDLGQKNMGTEEGVDGWKMGGLGKGKALLFTGFCADWEEK